MTTATRRDARQKPRVGKETAMRPLARIVLALSMGFASEMLFAQDPAPQGSEIAAPVPTPVVEDGAAVPEATIMAPADAMPSTDPDATAESRAASEAGGVPAESAPPTPVPSLSQNTDRVEPPLPPPPAPGVDVASVDSADLGPSERKSDWFFLAVIAVAVAVIATKLLHTRSERVSIHEERRLGGLS
jgi:hypothetical protein